jgi:hypothetical protein
VNREKREAEVGGGRFKIDLPGVGMVTAEDDGEGEKEVAMITSAVSLCVPICQTVPAVARYGTLPPEICSNSLFFHVSYPEYPPDLTFVIIPSEDATSQTVS